MGEQVDAQNARPSYLVSTREQVGVSVHDGRNRWKSPCLWAFIEIRRFLVFCVFGVDCNDTDNLESRFLA